MSEIVYRRRGLSCLYYFFLGTFVLLGLLFLMVSLGMAVEDGSWSSKYLNVIGFGIAGLAWLLGVPEMLSLGKSYGKNEVRLEGSMFSLRTPAGHDLQFMFSDVRQVSWNPRLRSRLCTVETDKMTYRFDARSCPRTSRVAYLVAERSGQKLQIQKS